MCDNKTLVGKSRLRANSGRCKVCVQIIWSADLFDLFKFQRARRQISGLKLYTTFVHNMAAEWNHCLSRDKIAALPPVTQTEYKLCLTPRAHTSMVETCEQTVSKAHKRNKMTAIHVVGLFYVFFGLFLFFRKENYNSSSLKLDIFAVMSGSLSQPS